MGASRSTRTVRSILAEVGRFVVLSRPQKGIGFLLWNPTPKKDGSNPTHATLTARKGIQQPRFWFVFPPAHTKQNNRYMTWTWTCIHHVPAGMVPAGPGDARIQRQT